MEIRLIKDIKFHKFTCRAHTYVCLSKIHHLSHAGVQWKTDRVEKSDC